MDVKLTIWIIILIAYILVFIASLSFLIYVIKDYRKRWK